MRKSLHETETIDRYLLGVMSQEEEAAFLVRLLLEDELPGAVYWQQRAHRLIRWLGRRERLESLFGRLMQDDAFRGEVDAIFGA